MVADNSGSVPKEREEKKDSHCEFDRRLQEVGARVEGLAEYSREEVAKHTTKETGIWVTFMDGVFDITKFVANHPGGMKRIMLAAGGDVGGFWEIYQQHLSKDVSGFIAGKCCAVWGSLEYPALVAFVANRDRLKVTVGCRYYAGYADW